VRAESLGATNNRIQSQSDRQLTYDNAFK